VKRTNGKQAGTAGPGLDQPVSPALVDEADEPVVEADLWGWTPHTSERRDCWHRLRAFPRQVVAWRKRMLRSIADQPERFPAVAAVADPADVQERLDTGIRFLREIARMLAVLHGTPDLANTTDPTDELVYIMSSRQTLSLSASRVSGQLRTHSCPRSSCR
jgi:hypothetical protein